MNERVVFVSGASRGIGAAIARTFAADGDQVVLHHRGSPELVEDVRRSLPTREGREHLVLQGNLADPDAIATMMRTVGETFGRLDVLVNNAAIYVEHKIMETSYDDWQRAWRDHLEVDLLGPANLIWHAVRLMRPGARIVNVSSRGAHRGEPRVPAYGASKAGLESLGQSMARALGPLGIAVTSVAPGYVETDMAREVLAGPEGERIRGESPLGRVATPDEVAAAVRYLASPDAEYASGAILDLNGASHLRS